MNAIRISCCLIALATTANAQDDLPGVARMCVPDDVLQPGDVIVTTTTSLVSRTIQRETNSPVSHAMVYVGRIDGHHMVVESVLTGVRRVRLNTALGDATLAITLRHPEMSPERFAVMKRFLDEKIGQKYDTWGVGQQLVCRWTGRLCRVSTADDRWYCSELVLAAFEKSKLPLVLRRQEFKAPGDIAKLVFTRELSYEGDLDPLRSENE